MEDKMPEIDGPKIDVPAIDGPDEGQIREIAYFLWIEEGCPEGRAHDHWMLACATLSVQPASARKEEAKAPQPVLHTLAKAEGPATP